MRQGQGSRGPRVARAALAAGVALALAAAGHGAVRAEEAAAPKIGFINLAKVFDSYERTKASDADLQKRGKQKEAELEGRMNELKKLRESLELLNEEAREAKAREVEQKAEELQRFRATTARDLRRDRDRAAKEILAEIQRALEEHAKAQGYTLILDSRSLLYGEGAHDLTDEILGTLNQKGKPVR